VRELSERMTPPEIAAELGISRQRVYQILSEESVDFQALHRDLRLKRRISRNLARHLGPESAHVDKHTRGAMAELIVAADLLACGWKPYVPLFRNHGHDIIATKAASLITVEVRSALRKADGSIAASLFTPTRRADHFAFVLPEEPVIYKPALPIPVVTAPNWRRGVEPQYAEADIERAARLFREQQMSYKELANLVRNRKGKAITPTQLKRRIDEHERRKLA
jgi:hypothetical protein